MKTQPECIPCLLKQATRTAGILTNDSDEIERFTRHIGETLKRIDMALSPPHFGGMIHRESEAWFGITDPYKKHKKDHIRQASSMIPELRKIVAESEDPLLAAIKLSIGGNAIDFGVERPFHLISELKDSFHQPLVINHYPAFRKELERAEQILFLGDNAGESVLDRLLIETIGIPVIFAARNRPAINDVTVEDAEDSGLSEAGVVISSGSNIPGTIPESCSRKFQEHLRQADLIISKGQGNFETLSDVKLPLFFLLKVKCHIVARDLNVPEGSFVLKSAIQQGIPI